MGNNVKLDYDSAIPGVDGCVYKAGFHNVNLGELDGYGIDEFGNSWESAADVNFTANADGIKGNGSGNIKFVVPTAQGLNGILNHRGSIQVSMSVKDLVSYLASSPNSKDMIRCTDSGGTALFNSPWVRFQSRTTATGYAQMFTDYLTNPVLGSHANLYAQGVAAGNSTLCNVGIAEDYGDKVLFTESWTLNRIYYFLDGVFVGSVHRAPLLSTEHDLGQILFQGGGFPVRMENLLIYKRPLLPKIGDVRVLSIGHSFGTRDNNTFSLPDGQVSSQQAFASKYQFSSWLTENLDFDIEGRFFGFSSMALLQASFTVTPLNQLIDNTDPLSTFNWVSPSANTYSHILTRWRPHFLLVYGTLYNTQDGNRLSGIDSIAAQAKAAGVIPVFIIEQNDTHATAPVDYTTQQQAIKDHIDAMPSGDAYYVDTWETFGSVIDASYVQDNDSAQIHPNFKASKVNAEATAKKLNEIYGSLLSQSPWSRIARGE